MLSEVHGRWHVGVAGYGFRTNVCPRSWASHPFVAEVLEAARWASNGMFVTVYGTRVPNKLIEAVDWFLMETNAVMADYWRKERERIRMENEARQKEQEG